MKCFYHDDLDGKAAGFVVDGWARFLNENDMIEFIPSFYGMVFPMDRIEKDEQVYIVDFSIPPETMTELLKVTKNVTWIDHHISSIKAYADYPETIRGVRSADRSGCVLTWMYLMWFTDRGVGPADITTRTIPMYADIPEVLLLVEDRDIWKWDRLETKNFIAYMNSVDSEPEADIWWQLMDQNITAPPECRNLGRMIGHNQSRDLWSEILLRGSAVNQYIDQRNMDMVSRLGYATVFEGKKCLVINAPLAGSEIFGNEDDVYSRVDMMIIYYHINGMFHVGLRSRNVDVSVIAEKYGGGGHPGAAGFECKELPF